MHRETKETIKKVWETTISDKYKPVTHEDKNVGKEEIEKWINRLTEADKHHISARIL